MKKRHTISKTKRILFLLLIMIATINSYAQTQTIQIASFNIQYDNKGDTVNSWEQRKYLVKDIVNDYGLDLIGVQEPMPHQLEHLKSLLSGYEILGTGVKGSVPVIYKKDRLKVLEDGIVWLSSTPDTPSVGWDASMQRKFRWVHFEQLESGKSFYFFNIHLDHLGVTAREEGVKILLTHLEKIPTTIPFIITGDFNSDQNSTVYKAMITQKNLIDSRHSAACVENSFWPSYNGYHVIHEMSKKDQPKIDHVFVSKNLTVLNWQLLNKDYDQRYPSDHFPIRIKLKL